MHKLNNRITLQLAATYLAYIFGKFACKVNIQRVSFALPLNLATPIAVVTLITLCKIRLGIIQLTRHDFLCTFLAPSPSFQFLQSHFKNARLRADIWIFEK